MEPIITPKVVSPTVDGSLYNYMLRSHRHLEDTYGRMLRAMEIEAPEMRRLWTELDHGVMAHMEAEERYVLPSFARIDRDEAVALLREHGRIREHLLELGVALDLHSLRLERAQAFIDALRAHGAREEALLYRWADKQLALHLVTATMEHARW